MNAIATTNKTASEGENLKMLKRLKKLSIFLGAVMFPFGFLKLFQPFSVWFHTQIVNAGLPLISIPAGIGTEMLVGLMFLIPWLSGAFSFQRTRQINIVASLILISQMLVATYVHLQPNVPAGVLPLGIKPPFIPLTVLVLAALNGFFFYKSPRKD
jgi:Na+/melibiose symporter-like transporter